MLNECEWELRLHNLESYCQRLRILLSEEIPVRGVEVVDNDRSWGQKCIDH